MELSSLLHGDLRSLIQSIGYFGIFAVIFAESGMMVGFFLPGDSLLFTAGFLASQGFFSIPQLVIGCFLAALAGDSFGYFIGRKWGRKLFNKKDSFFFRIEHLTKAENFYEKHGGKAIILARFVPVVRAFAPIASGIAKMKYSTFLIYDIVGGLLWAVGVLLAGFYLGSLIPDVDKYLLPIILLIILISISPGIIHAFQNKETRTKVLNLLKIPTK